MAAKTRSGGAARCAATSARSCGLQDPTFIAWYTARGYRYVMISWLVVRYPEMVARESIVLLARAGLLLATVRRTRPG